MKNLVNQLNSRFSFPFYLVLGVLLISCGGNNTEVATQYSSDETTEANNFNTEEQILIDDRENFENHEAVSVTIDNPETFNWKSFKDGFAYKNEQESADNKIVSNWIEWGEYQYRLEILKTANSMELLTFIRLGKDVTANKQLLTMEMADELKLSSLWTQMETLAVDLESNLDSKTIKLKSDV
jgi:hypothetical protein